MQCGSIDVTSSASFLLFFFRSHTHPTPTQRRLRCPRDLSLRRYLALLPCRVLSPRLRAGFLAHELQPSLLSRARTVYVQARLCFRPQLVTVLRPLAPTATKDAPVTRGDNALQAGRGCAAGVRIGGRMSANTLSLCAA